MILKLLIVLGIVWAGWNMWRGRPVGTKAKPAPRSDQRGDHEEAAARDVLGVSPDADEAAIRAAHRRLIAGVHPDRGGSAELTRRVNLARDLLIKRLRH